MEKRIISKFIFNPWKLINEKRYVIRKEIKYLTGREREREMLRKLGIFRIFFLVYPRNMND